MDFNKILLRSLFLLSVIILQEVNGRTGSGEKWSVMYSDLDLTWYQLITIAELSTYLQFRTAYLRPLLIVFMANTERCNLGSKQNYQDHLLSQS
ncbi:unnamed protein product [Schistosoma guineensis]|nr:unnamed protein product [Schistosoma guineensis]